MPRLRLLTLALVGVAALFVVACDGDSAEKNDYADEVNEVQSTLRSDLSKLSQTPQSPEQLVRYYEDTVTSLESAVDSLETIEPPDELAELHDQLIAEVQELADVITGAVGEIEQGGAAALPGAGSQLATAHMKFQREFSSTIDEINSTLQD